MSGPRDARARGEAVERLVAAWLTDRGLQPVAANQHAKGGELDLVMRDGETLVFVEVRHRADSRHSHPLETITLTKQRRLIRAARFYLQNNRLSCPCRFDVVAVTGLPPELDIQWVVNAFDAY
ncbi:MULTISPECIES: YraN family protein [unclassified Halomonas]|uniref:YraN family protein n=1 Tax=unclassified Halomonas TaxID=2609666 RepID=UPI0028876797|nr:MULTISPECIES: YraN family protein [unclassified Halomonas]MDT0500181.1 YraN family protein [Halomonas sp. PAR7]MDT0511325.1 YraN family protein [Halomonas sp. LES1]MDT0590387.1 YraN family protein [Halomonas sp. PAR8]